MDAAERQWVERNARKLRNVSLAQHLWDFYHPVRVLRRVRKTLYWATFRDDSERNMYGIARPGLGWVRRRLNPYGAHSS